MSVRLTRLLTSDGFTQLNNDGMALGMDNTDPRIFVPGTAWEMNWYYDPTGERERLGKTVMFTAEDRKNILSGAINAPSFSMYYWRDWSHIRPPISLVCPGNRIWGIDRRSSSGPGWKVTGEFPFLTCYPSIDFSPGYHGWLVKGLFSDNLNDENENVIPLKPKRA